MIALATLAGAVCGVLLRMFVERVYSARIDGAWLNSLTLTLVGAFVLGAVTGASLSTGRVGDVGGALGVALGAALFTYCVFSGAAIRLAGRPERHGGVSVTVIHAVGGLVAAVPGVALAAWAVAR